jgi:hypothetical protein
VFDARVGITDVNLIFYFFLPPWYAQTSEEVKVARPHDSIYGFLTAVVNKNCNLEIKNYIHLY